MLQKERKLAWSNIHYKKSVTISLTLLVFLVAFFLDICLSLRDIPRVMDATHVALNGCDLRVELFEPNGGVGKFTGDIQAIDGVSGVECVKYTSFGQAAVFADAEREIEKKEIVERCEKSDSEKYGICLPVSMKSNGWRLGDTYIMEQSIFGKSTVTCEITAFARYPSMFGTDALYNTDSMRVDMEPSDYARFDATYRNLCEKNGYERIANRTHQYYLITFAANADPVRVQLDISNIPALKEADPSYMTYSEIRENELFYLSLYSGILTAFCILVLFVVCFVILSRISDVMHSDMRAIGTLGAMGFSCGEMRTAYALQYLFYTVAGTAAGILVSYASTPLINRIVSKNISYAGSVAALHPVPDAITALSILLLILVVLLLATRKFKKFPPVVALSGGMQSHSFRKNYAPVEAGTSNLPVIFAKKSILRDKRTLSLILCSVMLLTFSTCTIMNIKDNLNRDEFWCYILGYENPKAYVYVAREESENVKKGIDELEGVDKALLIRGARLDTDGYYKSLSFTCMEDFSQTKYLSVMRGEMPTRENEIALEYLASKALSKDVGDKITLSCTYTKEDEQEVTQSAEYLITGITDNANGECLMTLAGSNRFDANFGNYINVYSDSLNYEQIKEEIIAVYGEPRVGEKIWLIDDSEKMMRESVGTYQSSLDIITHIMTLVTFWVILFVLIVVVRAALNNRRQEFGIQKAMGFHSGEIIFGIILTYFPVVSAGAVLGGAASLLTSCPLVRFFFSTFLEMRNVNLIRYPSTVLMFAGAIALFAFCITLLFSLKIRRITPYEMICE